MEAALMEKLYGYIKENNPDIFMALQEEGKLKGYINDKVNSMPTSIKAWQEEGRPNYIIEEECLYVMTADLRPSKFHYINNILEEEFEARWLELNNNGLLRYELINITTASEEVFVEMGFTEENEYDNQLRYAVIGTIAGYLEKH